MIHLMESKYFARRARESRSAAGQAAEAGAAGIHRTLAVAYDRLASTEREASTVQDQQTDDEQIASDTWNNEGGANSVTAMRAS